MSQQLCFIILHWFHHILTFVVQYCLCWATAGSLSGIQLIMNRAMRIILNCPRDTSIVSMLQRTQLLSVKQRLNYNVLLFMFKATKQLLPPYITNQLAYVADVQPYALRSNHNLRLPQLLSNMGQRSFLYRGAQMFNDLIRDGIPTNVLLNNFKATLRDYMIDKY